MQQDPRTVSVPSLYHLVFKEAFRCWNEARGKLQFLDVPSIGQSNTHFIIQSLVETPLQYVLLPRFGSNAARERERVCVCVCVVVRRIKLTLLTQNRLKFNRPFIGWEDSHDYYAIFEADDTLDDISIIKRFAVDGGLVLTANSTFVVYAFHGNPVQFDALPRESEQPLFFHSLIPSYHLTLGACKSVTDKAKWRISFVDTTHPTNQQLRKVSMWQDLGVSICDWLKLRFIWLSPCTEFIYWLFLIQVSHSFTTSANKSCIICLIFQCSS
jgi:hypothetical protein